MRTLKYLKVHKKQKLKKNFIDTNKWSQKLTQKIFSQTQKNLSLKIRLSIRVRNFAALNEPPNIYKK